MMRKPRSSRLPLVNAPSPFLPFLCSGSEGSEGSELKSEGFGSVVVSREILLFFGSLRSLPSLTFTVSSVASNRTP